MEFPKDLPSASAAVHSPVTASPSGPDRPHWVPIRPLAQRHRGRILLHLLALNENDRYLRFGYAASDVQVALYVDLIDFNRDEVFGVFNRRLELIAQAHLAALPGDQEAEFGVSVLPKARGRGFGARLFDRALLHARNHGIDTLVIHALTQNVPMLRIVRAAGATVERAGGESTARLRVPRDDLRSHIGQIVETGAAEIDYRLKVQAQRTANVLDVIDELRTHSMAPGQAARE
ncbi:MAG: GNAT family N-acetyltransferase [Aquincola sp.]|nr:GNAT family N-acetyltransferase [Aquincola sp.]MDH4287620.1 GNAT family N-acetyltransferase [Aquincola sp.]MDH5330897.1 GNAT family N-acetyltransferase [Aquincola sp.]